MRNRVCEAELGRVRLLAGRSLCRALGSLFLVLAAARTVASMEEDAWLAEEFEAVPEAPWMVRPEPGLAFVELDCESRHAGQASLRIRHPGLASTVLSVPVHVPRWSRGRVRVWTRLEGVATESIGFDVTVADVEGMPVAGLKEDAWCDGTHSWTELEIPFWTGAQTSLFVHLTLDRLQGTVWLDDLRVEPGWGTWFDAVAAELGAAATALPRPLLDEYATYEYGAVTTDVATPHVPVCLPTRASRVRALVIGPAWGQRETVEVMQRFPLDVEVVMTSRPGQWAVSDPLYGTLPAELVDGQAAGALTGAWDVVMLAQQQWGSIPERFRREIVERVEAGRGLLVVGARAAAVADPPFLQVPELKEMTWHETGRADAGELLAKVPIAELEARLGPAHMPTRFWRGSGAGRGRLGWLELPVAPAPHESLTPVQDAHHAGADSEYDAWLSLVGGALLDLAGAAAPDGVLERIAFLGAPRAAAPGSASVAVKWRRGAAVGSPDRLTVELFGGAGRAEASAVLSLLLPQRAEWIELPVPALARGQHLALARLWAGSEVVDWRWASCSVAARGVIQALLLDDEAIGPEDRLSGAVRLAGGVDAAQARVRVELVDAQARLLARQEILPEALTVPFSLRPARLATAAGQLRASLELDGATADVAERLVVFRAPAGARQRLHLAVMGAEGRDPVAVRIQARLAQQYGVDAQYVHLPAPGGDRTEAAAQQHAAVVLEGLLRCGLRSVPAVTSIRPANNPVGPAIREPCLHDPAYRDALVEQTTVLARAARRYRPLAYTLGDENYLGFRSEFCFGEHSARSFREWLARRWETPAALAAATGWQVGTWADVAAPTRADAAAAGLTGAWVEHRRHMDQAFAGAHRLVRQGIGRVDPGVPVGFEGPLGNDPYFGYSWELLAEAIDWWNSYNVVPYHLFALRSFARGKPFVGEWFGGYTAERVDEALLRLLPWRHLFEGWNCMWFYTVYGRARGGGGLTGLQPDLRPALCWAIPTAELAQIRDGIDLLLMDRDRADTGVLVLYSPESAHYALVRPALGDAFAAQLGMLQLLEDCGLRPRLADAARLRVELRDARVRLVALSVAHCLDPGLVDELRLWVEAGGMLLGDWALGLANGVGGPLPAGAPDPLEALFGVARDGYLPGVAIDGLGASMPGGVYERSLRVRDAAAAFTIGSAPGEQAPLWASRRVGLGETLYLNGSLARYPELSNAWGRPLRAALAQRLAARGPLTPVVLGGEADPWCWNRLTLMEDGAARYIGIYRREDAPDGRTRLRAQLPGAPRFWYDLRRGGALVPEPDGAVAFELEPGEAAVLAALPYQVESVEARPVTAGEERELLLELRVNAAGRAEPGRHVLTLAWRDPGGDEVPLLREQVEVLSSGLALHGVRFPPDAARGSWRLDVRDRATGARGTATVEVP